MPKANETVMQAIAKIEQGEKDFTGDDKGKVIYIPLAEKLKRFCEQSERFAQKILDGENLSVCCKEITQDIKFHCSDFEIYERAVKYYWGDADIKESFDIVEPGSIRGGHKVINLNLADFM